MSARSSLKRRGPPVRYQMMFGVQAPPRNLMHSPIGQSGGELFLRILSTMTAISPWLPIGYLKMVVTINHVVTIGNPLGMVRAEFRSDHNPWERLHA